jgi:hypothetical protein
VPRHRHATDAIIRFMQGLFNLLERGFIPAGLIVSQEIYTLSPGDQHAKDLMLEYGLQLFQFQKRDYPEHPSLRSSSRP